MMGQLSEQVALLWLADAVRPDARGDEGPILLAQPSSPPGLIPHGGGSRTIRHPIPG